MNIKAVQYNNNFYNNNNNNQYRYHYSQENDIVSFSANTERNTQFIKNLEHLKQKKGGSFDNCNSEEIFNAIGIKTRRKKNGLLIISEYRQPDNKYTFSQLGIDEDKLVEDISVIEGNSDFSKSDAKIYKNLEYVGGNFRLTFNNSKSFPVLKEISKSAYFYRAKDISLPRLEKIGGSAICSHSIFTDINNLKEVNGDMQVRDSNLAQLDISNVKVNGLKRHIDWRG